MYTLIIKFDVKILFCFHLSFFVAMQASPFQA